MTFSLNIFTSFQHCRKKFFKNGYIFGNHFFRFSETKKGSEICLSHCLKIVFRLQKRYVINKIRIYGALKIALKNHRKPWFYWLCGYVIYFDHSSHHDWMKSMPDGAGCALVYGYFSKECFSLFLLKIVETKKSEMDVCSCHVRFFSFHYI